jgi:hypothetical protein
MAAQGTDYKLHDAGLLCGARVASCTALATAVCSQCYASAVLLASSTATFSYTQLLATAGKGFLYQSQLQATVAHSHTCPGREFCGVAALGSGSV